jgi:hypothetical protein
LDKQLPERFRERCDTNLVPLVTIISSSDYSTSSASIYEYTPAMHNGCGLLTKRLDLIPMPEIIESEWTDRPLNQDGVDEHQAIL